MDDLNQHECMANLIAVIKHMQQKNITPPVPTVSIRTTGNIGLKVKCITWFIPCHK